MPTKHEIFARALLAGMLAAVLAPATAQISGSSSFVLSQTTLGGGGEAAASPSFVLGHTTGQESVVGEAGSASFVLQSGFWTSASVNRVLTVDGTGTGDGSIDGDFFACAVSMGAASGDCEQTTVHGTTLTATATAAPGSFFTGWSGCDSLSMSGQTDDTCAVVVNRDVTATAEFIAAGGLGDRVWLDYDGDGVQETGEPGVPGVDVSLSGGTTPGMTVTTDADGLYAFAGLFPDDYTVSIDPGTLPAGTVPTFDADGVATPHAAVVTALSGQTLDGVDFGIQPLADLEVSITAETLGGATVWFTVTVENLGQADATGVVADNQLAGNVALTTTNGCAEDPGGVPACTLGELAAGQSTVYTVRVEGTAGGPPDVSNTVSVSAVEADPATANNTVSGGGFVFFPVPALGWSGLALLAVLLLLLARRRLATG